MLDDLAVFSDDQAITASAASTNSLLLMPFTGQGEPVTILVRVTEDFVTLTSLTVAVQQSSDDASYTDVVVSKAIAAASLVAGAEFPIRFMPNNDEDYVQLYYTVAGSNATAGKIFAAIVEGEDFPYKDGLYFSPRNPTGAAATA